MAKKTKGHSETVHKSVKKITSIGNSKRTRIKNKHKRRQAKGRNGSTGN